MKSRTDESAGGATLKLAGAALRETLTQKAFGSVETDFARARMDHVTYAVQQGRDIGWVGRALVSANIASPDNPLVVAAQGDLSSGMETVRQEGLPAYADKVVARIEEVLPEENKRAKLNFAALRRTVNSGHPTPKTLASAFGVVAMDAWSDNCPDIAQAAAGGFAVSAQHAIELEQTRDRGRRKDAGAR